MPLLRGETEEEKKWEEKRETSRRSPEGWDLRLDVADGIVPTGLKLLSRTAKRWRQAPMTGAREAKQNAAEDPVRPASIVAVSMPIRMTSVACASA